MVDFATGFWLAIGWIAAKVLFYFVVGFIDYEVSKAWPKYRKMIDELDARRHPWRYKRHLKKEP